MKKDLDPKISIIIPVHNAEKYIEKAVQSVVEQSYTNWELFLVENGSKDSSLKISRELAEKNEKIQLIEEKRKGVGFARNTGLDNATGEYILFIDADDYLTDSNVFQRYINIIEQTKTDIIVSNYARLWKEKLLPAAEHSLFSVYNPDSEEFRFRGFFSVGTLSYVWGKLYRKSFLDKNNIVFSDGNPKTARAILIGEAPGENEDKTGTPFVGRAGKLLNEFLEKAEISREKDLYIINTVKCRPPKNRVPTDSEKAACEEYLLKQIETIDPKIMIFCGATALKSFYPQKTAISKIRGEVLELEIGGKKRKCIPIFHPSYLLRYHSLEEGSPRDLMLKDLKKIQDLIKV